MFVHKYLKPIVLEWIVTNGSMIGFAERLEQTKKFWSVVGPEGMKVYRGQGHTKPGIPSVGDPEKLEDGLRPVIATSSSQESAIRYAGPKCCLFEIALDPGTRYIDVKNLFTFPDKDTHKDVTAVSNATISEMAVHVAGMPPNYWLQKAIKNGSIQGVVRSVFNTRVNSELEIMVDGSQGKFDVTPVEHFKTFSARYTRKGGRVPSLRRRTRRKNKNGRRSTYKSKDGRNRRARHRRDSHDEL
jgi:hypothetical protein